jgi:hypothetical protein
MPKYRPEDFTPEQSEAYEHAAFSIIKARKEAAAMMTRAGLPNDWFGRPCAARIDGPGFFGNCPCSDYKGDGGPCETMITIDPEAPNPPFVNCGHPPSKHLPT